jgi:2-polyprenyl-3-methyl-5-hydroxy-6-metoxy-1,4-benzoquinol methylase
MKFMVKKYIFEKAREEKGDAQYDKISKEYAEISQNDPSKLFVQYPEAFRLLGDIKGKSILDIGCGNGYFAEQLVKNGADVTGYDISKKQIDKANASKDKHKLDIIYTVSSPENFSVGTRFDKAVSILVLLYAESKENLTAFLSQLSSI